MNSCKVMSNGLITLMGSDSGADSDSDSKTVPIALNAPCFWLGQESRVRNRIRFRQCKWDIRLTYEFSINGLSLVKCEAYMWCEILRSVFYLQRYETMWPFWLTSCQCFKREVCKCLKTHLNRTLDARPLRN